MTAAEIKTWVYSHINMKNQIVFNMEGHYKIKFKNGDTYEYSSIEKEYCRELITIWINEKLAKKAIYEGRWLDNGSWGHELIAELPIEETV